jgi:hypothetical protein
MRSDLLSDDTVELLLRGEALPGLDALTAFLAEVRDAGAGPGPAPGLDLAWWFAEGISTDKGDLLATAGSNADGPATQAAGLPTWRRARKMVHNAVGKLAALGLAAKVALGGGAVALAATGIAASGTQGDPADEEVQVVLEDTTTDTTVPEETDEVTDATEPEGDEPEGDEEPANHGAVVSEAAKDHSHDEECGNHGKWVSSVARCLDSCLDEEESTEDTDESVEEATVERAGPQSVPGSQGKGKGKGRQR